MKRIALTVLASVVVAGLGGAAKLLRRLARQTLVVLLSAKGRCLTVDQGYDRVGRERKNNLQLHPDSPANMKGLSDIRNGSNEVHEERLFSLSSIK